MLRRVLTREPSDGRQRGLFWFPRCFLGGGAGKGYLPGAERGSFIDDLLVRTHFIIEMVW